QWIRKERATPPGPKRTAARRVAPNLAWGFVARRSQPHWRGMLPPRASPQAKLGATNVIAFTPLTTKAGDRIPRALCLGLKWNALSALWPRPSDYPARWAGLV